MEMYILVNMRMEKHMDKVNIFLRINLILKVILNMGKEMDMEFGDKNLHRKIKLKIS